MRPDYVGTSLVPEWPDYIEIKVQEQIEGLARACQLARHVLLLAGRSLKVSAYSQQVTCVFLCCEIQKNPSLSLTVVTCGFQVGMTTDEIDFIVHQETIEHNAYPSPLRYGGFPKSVCTSVNNVVCHGIPDR